METMVAILRLIVKTDIVLIEGIVIEMLEESKINEVKIVESKTKVDKIGELTMDALKIEEVKIGEVITKELNLVDEGFYSLVDEVGVTFANDMLS